MAHVSISGKFTGKISPRPATRTTKKKPTGRRQKKNSTNDKESCFKCFFFLKKSFHSFLGQLLSFYLLFVAGSFSIHDEVSESKKEDTSNGEWPWPDLT